MCKQSRKISTTKTGEHISCGYSVWAFDHVENKHTSYRGQGCLKKFCIFLREHATNITNF